MITRIDSHPATQDLTVASEGPIAPGGIENGAYPLHDGSPAPPQPSAAISLLPPPAGKRKRNKKKKPKQPGPWATCLDGVPLCGIGVGSGYTPDPIDVRWRLAGRLARHRSAPSGEDAWTVKAAEFLAELVLCQDEGERRQLAEKMPDIEAAYQLSQADKLTRGLVQGRLLARQSSVEIAAACNLTPEAVEAFHAVFFDVRGLLNNGVYVVTQVIGAEAWSRATEADVDLFLMRLGYRLGPYGVTMAEKYFRCGVTVPERLDGLTKEQLDDLHMLLVVRGIVFNETLPGTQLPRLQRFGQLLGELGQFIEAWADPADGTTTGPASLAPPRAVRERWDTWRAAMVAASSGCKPTLKVT
jgi:hypothetical protein